MQSWSEMTPEGHGRFCGACSQTVIDFSSYTDEQLIAFFSTEKTDRVCGRFRDSQVTVPIGHARRWWTWVRSVAAVLLPFLMTSKADAQKLDSLAQVDGREPNKVRPGRWQAVMGKPIVNRIEPVRPNKQPKDDTAPLSIDRRKDEEGKLNP